MTGYGHDLLFGAFVTPAARDPERVVGLSQLAERAGLDLVTFQDHPYQPAFLDTWTLLSFVGAATSRIRLSANVLNLPLRLPVVVARSAASLDLLTGGRVELGIGAGGFWDAIEAVGGRRLGPGQAVDALDEGIRIIREVWAAERRGGVRVEGTYYRAVGAKRGPAAAHDIGIWVGGYRPRMLRLIGRRADGWLPSLPYLANGAADLTEMNARIDEAATAAGRDPRAVRRLLNLGGEATHPEELARLALEHGVSGFIAMGDDPNAIQRYGEEIAPAVRELVAKEGGGPPEGGGKEAPATAALATPTPDPAVRLSARKPWDESTRPVAPPAPPGFVYPERAQAIGQHLVDVHDHLRRELAQVRDILEQVKAGAVSAAAARSALHDTAMRQNDWTLGAFCASYCTLVSQHHAIEDQSVFPHLRRADAGLAPVIDRLEEEHVVIHEVVEGVDRALVELIQKPGDFTGVQEAIDLLTDALLSHLAYEEQQIVEPLARFGFYPGQL